MYQSLLPILKPLVFEGKSGILTVSHASGDQARFYLREGLIEQVCTSALQGAKAVKECMSWVSITGEFSENEQGEYTPAPDIEIASILAHLEKISKNIEVIRQKVPDRDCVLRIDSSKLSLTDKLVAADLKIALLYDGNRTIAEAVQASGKSELVVLTRTCRLILAKVALRPPQKEPLIEQERNFFLYSLEETLLDLIGLAGPILVEDAFAKIQCQPETLSQEDIEPLLSTLGEMLDHDEQEQLTAWKTAYLGDRA